MNNLWKYILIAVGLLTFGLFRPKARADELPPAAQPIDEPTAFLDDVDNQEELSRLQAFMQANPEESQDTFYWCKGLFSTWISDQADNYNSFFKFGLKPITNEDLLKAKASFEKGLSDVNAELTSRGL